MNTYGFVSVSAGVDGSLKEIDPLDAVGDGSMLPLVFGDRAVGTDNGTLIFYSLESESGHTDNGSVEVVPESNHGDFYWKRQGYTKDTFSGAFAGDEFIVSSLIKAPEGFVESGTPGREIDYTQESFTIYEPPFTDDVSYYASALYDNKIFVVTGSEYYKLDRDTGVITTTQHAAGGDYYWQASHSDDDTDGAAKYISDVSRFDVSPIVLNRFDMEAKVDETIAINLPPGFSWSAKYGTDRYSSGVRIGKYHYLVGGGTGSNRIGCSRIDILSGDLEELANVPGSGVEAGLLCPDLTSGTIYRHGELSNAPLYRYNISDNTWDTLFVIPDGYNIAEYYPSWFDENTKSIIICGNDLRIYDIDNETVSVSDATWNTDEMNYGFTVFYKSLGSFQFVGVVREYSPGLYDYPHAHIPASGLLKITKQ